MLAKKSENFMPTFRYNEFQKDQLMMICWLSLGGLDIHIYYYTDKSQKIQSFPESLEKRNPFYTKASITFDAEKMLTESDVHDISNALMKIL